MSYWKIPFFFTLLICTNYCEASVPILLNTWKFVEAAENAWETLNKPPFSAIDAVVAGGTTCQNLQCDHTVGYGGSPDENGESTLDAMIFDGNDINMGAVGGLRRIKDAIHVARHVLENTKHSFLVGDLATEFAKNFNFTEESLSSNYSSTVWKNWKENSCQPNFWTNVAPDPTNSCGPYHGTDSSSNEISQWYSSENHDTIGIIAIDRSGHVVAGTSTNGANYKIPGRVGDSPIPGAGAYADSEVGAAVATGDGDVMMRFLPSFLAVEELRRGANPTKAAQIAINRITGKYPNFFGAVLVSTNKGKYGAACNGMDYFPFCIGNEELGGIIIKTINCTNNKR